jgi:hypothetical protein
MAADTENRRLILEALDPVFQGMIRDAPGGRTA